MQPVASDITALELIIFTVIVLIFLYVDIKTGDPDKPVSIKKAAIWSSIWVAVSMFFAGYIAMEDSVEKSMTFITAYFLEKSLAVDNLFVFMAIFSSFSIAEKYQHRILHWGILGALVFRGIFIGVGVGVIFGAGAMGTYNIAGITMKPLSIVFFIFGILVLLSAYELLKTVTGKKPSKKNNNEDYSKHWAVNPLHKWFPHRISSHLDTYKFFTHLVDSENNTKTLAVTPLFLCLIVIEASDIMFAFDSVPAIFAVTQEPYLVYTSNIFAVLGLRSMYFLLAAAQRQLCHLEKAVFVILGFIGFKMIAFEWIHIKPVISLCVVLGLLTIGILSSFIWPEKEAAVA